jgi:hypothetical protein
MITLIILITIWMLYSIYKIYQYNHKRGTAFDIENSPSLFTYGGVLVGISTLISLAFYLIITRLP